MVVKKRGLLKSTKKKSPVNLSTYRTLGGERGIVNMNHLLTDYMRRFEWPEIEKIPH